MLKSTSFVAPLGARSLGAFSLNALSLVARSLAALALCALAACTTVTTADPNAAVVPGGSGVPGVSSLRDVGAACAFDDQCASQRCSADVPSGACGVCLDARKLGEPCDGPLQGCSASAICQDGICQSTKKVIGEPCGLEPKGGDLHECDDELFCAGTWDSQGTCKALTPLGGMCGTGLSRCIEGAYCAYGTCAAIPADSCQWHGCGDGYFCNDADTCVPATLQLGDLCGIVEGSFVDNECVPGTVCGSLEWPQGGGGPGTVEACVALPKAGEVCIHDQCADGLFCSEQTTDSSGVVPRRCDPLRKLGEACSTSYVFHKDCAAGLECRNEICEAACK